MSRARAYKFKVSRNIEYSLENLLSYANKPVEGIRFIRKGKIVVFNYWYPSRNIKPHIKHVPSINIYGVIDFNNGVIIVENVEALDNDELLLDLLMYGLGSKPLPLEKYDIFTEIYDCLMRGVYELECLIPEGIGKLIICDKHLKLTLNVKF